MSVKKEIVRGAHNEKIGSITTDSSNDSAVVRDEHERLLGRTNESLHTTRDEHNRLVSTNTADPGLLINRKE